jgi:hypothetical protein
MANIETIVKWDRVFEHWIRPGDGSQKIFTGVRDPRICRFCGRDRSQASFRSDAHIIPAAFGNRSLFSHEECDDCNHKVGSVLENDLANYLAMPRALSRLPARRGSGMPKIKTSPRNVGFVQSQPAENRVYTYLPTENEGIRIQDDGNGKLHLSMDIPKHRNINVAKAIGRMSLFCLDANFPGLDRVREWVCGQYHLYPIPLVTLSFPGTGYNRAGCGCYKYIQTPGRNIVRFQFFYSSYLCVVPFPLDDQPLPEGLPILDYPAPILKTLVENTSFKIILDDSIESGGIAHASMSYQERTEDPSG